MADVTLLRRHKHAGHWHEVGDKLTVSPVIADWLIGLAVATPVKGSNKKRDEALASVASDVETDVSAAVDANISGE